MSKVIPTVKAAKMEDGLLYYNPENQRVQKSDPLWYNGKVLL